MKERMKSILFVLALALVFVGATKMTEAKAADSITVNYKDETVTVVAASGSVYYQVLKTSEDSIKAANWVPAAKSDNGYLIDISALSNTKDSYVAYATSPNAEDKAGGIDVVAKVKSVKATLNYEEETPETLYDVIAKLDLKGIAKQKADDRVWPATEGAWKGDKKLSDLVTLGWKRGANGDWDAATNFDKVDWQMMKSSNTTLYLRVEDIDLDANGVQESYRYSKEAKVKVPKTAKAPNVKVDYKKGTVAIKNGMEFRLKNTEKWVTVGIKDKNAATSGSAFNVKKTALAKSSVTMAELKEQLNLTAGQEYTLEIRTSATDKKFMSNINELTITLPVAAPNATGTSIKSAVSGGMITFALDKITGLDANKKYEYVLSKGDIDVANTKFVAFDGEALEVNADKRPSYKYIDSEGKSKSGTAKYSEADTLWIREIGEYKTAPLKFAGEVAKITLE